MKISIFRSFEKNLQSQFTAYSIIYTGTPKDCVTNFCSKEHLFPRNFYDLRKAEKFLMTPDPYA